MPTITQPELFFVNNPSCLKPYNQGCKVMSMNTLGKRLEFARKRLRPKVSQKALGERVGLSQQMIGKLENDQSEETAAIVRIATELEVRPEWLETGQGPMAEDVLSLKNLSFQAQNAVLKTAEMAQQGRLDESKAKLLNDFLEFLDRKGD